MEKNSRRWYRSWDVINWFTTTLNDSVVILENKLRKFFNHDIFLLGPHILSIVKCSVVNAIDFRFVLYNLSILLNLISLRLLFSCLSPSDRESSLRESISPWHTHGSIGQRKEDFGSQ